MLQQEDALAQLMVLQQDALDQLVMLLNAPGVCAALFLGLRGSVLVYSLVPRGLWVSAVLS